MKAKVYEIKNTGERAKISVSTNVDKVFPELKALFDRLDITGITLDIKTDTKLSFEVSA